jgi:ABC-2 type transport system permease protein
MATSVTARSASGAPTSSRLDRFQGHVNLTRELALTAFKLKYTGSVLGYLWSLVKPAMIFAISYAVFAQLLKAGSATVKFPLQLLFAVVLWGFFADTVSGAIGSIASNGHIVRKAYFPRAILVIASSLTAFLTFIINFTLVFAAAGAAGALELHLYSFAVIPLMIELYALILGLSMLLAAFFVFYRDLGHVWEVSSQLLFYCSAVVFPFVLIPTRFQKLIAVNPVAQVIEDVRHALVSSNSAKVPWTAEVLGPWYFVPLTIAVGALIVGALVFHRLSPRFAESL